MAGLILKNFKSQLDKFVNSSVKNVKKAAASALQDVAVRAKEKALPEGFAKKFTVRNEKFPGTSRYTKPTPNNLKTTISYPFDWMELHTVGGTKTPTKKRMLAVPLPDLMEKSFRSANGKVKRVYKPASLLAHYNGFGSKKEGKKTQKAQAFLHRTKRGEFAIGKRKTKNSREVQWLYWLTKRTKMKPNWKYQEIVNNVYHDIFEEHFARWLKFYDEKDLENKK